MTDSAPQVIVVLGCRVREGQPGGALTRRLMRALVVAQNDPELPVLFSGGRAWDGICEGDAMRAWWKSRDPQRPAFVETKSQTTLQNARFSAEFCKNQGFSHIALVTCDFHMRRATRLFAKNELSVTAYPAKTPGPSWQLLKMYIREFGASCLAPWEERFR